MKYKFSWHFLKTIIFKVSMIYLSLAVINIAFFTSIIFENQVDLITDNSKLQAEKFVNMIIASLRKAPGTESIKEESAAADRIDSIIRPLIKEYIIFSQTGEILLKSTSDFSPPSSYVMDGAKSVASQDFTGTRYYLKIDEKAFKMYFYIPLREYIGKNSILFIMYDIRHLGTRLDELYRQAVLIFVITSLFHIFFAVIGYRIFVRPILRLQYGIREISEGRFSARVDVASKDEIGELAGAFNTMAHKLQENKKTIEKQMETIHELAITDELTGLYNRRYLFRRMKDEMKRTIKRDYDLSFMMIDIDHFKDFNDRYGHQTGDLVLKEVSRVIRNSCKETDIVARYGGEEMVVMALDCPMKDLLNIAERIRSRVEDAKMNTKHGSLSVTVSLGVTCFTSTLRETIGSPESLIFFADRALYRAKAKGRNRVEIG